MNARKYNRSQSQPISSRNARGPETVVCLLVLLFASSGCLSTTGLRAGRDRDFAILAQSPDQSVTTVELGMFGDNSQKDFKTLARAERLYRKGDLKTARQLLRAAREKNPGFRDALQMEANLARDLGDQDDYIALLRAIMDTYPQSAPIQNAVGNLLAYQRPGPDRTETHDVGIEALRRAVELEPHTARYARDLAAGYVADRDFTAAKKTLVDALRRNPADEQLPFALARLAEVTGEWESAVSYFDLGIRRNPNAVQWRRTRAHCLYRMGDYQRARHEYGLCYRDPSEDFSLVDYVEFGDACLQVGDYALAQEAFDTISRNSHVRLKDVELLRGLCAWHQGQRAHARGILTTALTYWPHDTTLRDVLQLYDAENGPAEPPPSVPEPLPDTSSIQAASITP